LGHLQTRMGITTNLEVLFDLDEMMQETTNLTHLAEPFTTEQIDRTIKDTPSERAPGPDGFNVQLLKRCWHIIKQDFYQLC
jgi:hypothetical protein